MTDAEYVYTTRTSHRKDVFHTGACRYAGPDDGRSTRHDRAALERAGYRECKLCSGEADTVFGGANSPDHSYLQSALNAEVDDDRPDYADPAYLRRAYYERGLTTRQMGAECGCSGSTIRRYMDAHGLERRPDATAEEVTAG